MAKRHNEPYRLFKRGEIYHAYISYIAETGERIQLRETTHCMDETQAVNYCIQRLAELQKKTRQQISGELPSITIDEAFARYFLEKGQYLSRPQEKITRLNKLKKDFAVTFLHDIDETIINRFVNINKSSLSNATINRYLSIYSVIRKTAEEEWKVKTYPIKISKFMLKEPAENIKYLKDWSIAQKIIDRAAPHLKPIIYTALYTGLRLGNILGLKWDNIDFTTASINIKVKDRTKLDGKNHSIPIYPDLMKIIKEQPQINDYVFNFRGKPIKSIIRSWHYIFYDFVPISKKDLKPDDVYETRTIINKNTKEPESVIYKRVLRDPALPYINFHTLRHTFATWVLRKTNNLRTTKELLGHADIRTTLKYAHTMDEEKRRALDSVFSK